MTSADEGGVVVTEEAGADGEGEAGGWGEDDVVLEGLDDTRDDAAAAEGYRGVLGDVFNWGAGRTRATMPPRPRESLQHRCGKLFVRMVSANCACVLSLLLLISYPS